QPTALHHQRIQRSGGKLRSEMPIIRADAYQVTPETLSALAADPDVAYVAPDRDVRGALDYTAPTVGADLAANYGLTGQGVAVAVIDSGMADHWDLRSGGGNDYEVGRTRVVYAESFLPNASPSHQAPSDQYGHGTHVAGIIGGNAWFSTGKWYTRTFRGIAPRVDFVNLRVLDEQGQGRDSYVINAIQRAIQLKSRYNIRIINLSLGRPVFTSYQNDPLCQAVEAAWKAGIVVVVAAGNDGRDDANGTKGYGTIDAPGNDPYVITVGAMKTMKTVSRA